MCQIKTNYTQEQNYYLIVPLLSLQILQKTFKVRFMYITYELSLTLRRQLLLSLLFQLHLSLSLYFLIIRQFRISLFLTIVFYRLFFYLLFYFFNLLPIVFLSCRILRLFYVLLHHLSFILIYNINHSYLLLCVSLIYLYMVNLYSLLLIQRINLIFPY